MSVNIFIFLGVSDAGSSLSENVFRLTRTPVREVDIAHEAEVDHIGRVGSILQLMGIGIENAPSFTEGIQEFIGAVAVNLSIEQINELTTFITEELDLEDAVLNDAERLMNMAKTYASGLRRDQADMIPLRAGQINLVVAKLHDVIGDYHGEYIGFGKDDTLRMLDIATQMAGLWATGPISPKKMFDALRGERMIIEATNPRMVAVIMGKMIQSMQTGQPLIFELAASECNQKDGYAQTSTPQQFVDAVRYCAFVLGYDLPYGVNLDHLKVTSEGRIQFIKDLIVAHLEAGKRYLDRGGATMFAFDASSLPYIRAELQLKALNSMTYENFLAVPHINEAVARKLADHGEFKSLTELIEISGIEEKGIRNLMAYIKSEILVKVLNDIPVGGLADELKMIDGMSDDLAERIVAYRQENNGFGSLDELYDLDPEAMDKVVVSLDVEIPDYVRIEGEKSYTLEYSLFEYLEDYLDLRRINELTIELGGLIPDELDATFEAENGHVGGVDPLTGRMILTTPLQVIVTLRYLKAHDMHADEIATANGSIHGYAVIDGVRTSSAIDIRLTWELFAAASSEGAGIAQHGGSGNSLATFQAIRGAADKLNVATYYMYKALEYIPESLFKKMAAWTVGEYWNKYVAENDIGVELEDLIPIEEIRREHILHFEDYAGELPEDIRQAVKIYADLLNSYVKKSIAVHSDELDNLAPGIVAGVADRIRESGLQWSENVNAYGALSQVLEHLGWTDSPAWNIEWLITGPLADSGDLAPSIFEVAPSDAGGYTGGTP